MSDIAAPIETAIVVVSSKLKDGSVKSQDIQVRHKQGQPVSEIIFAALQVFRSVGGIIEDTQDGGINFYGPYLFDGPVNFSRKMVSLAA